MTTEQLEAQIRDSMSDVAEMLDNTLALPIQNDTVLLECGLDSLGFAMLVAKLEEDLGYDPFVLMDDAIYPRTFGEFVSLYTRYHPDA